MRWREWLLRLQCTDDEHRKRCVEVCVDYFLSAGGPKPEVGLYAANRAATRYHRYAA